MNKKIIIPIVIILVIIGVVFVLQSPEVEDLNGEEILDEEIDEEVPDEDISFYIEAEGREFYVDGEENPDIVVSQGEEVLIELMVTGGTHDFVIDEFDAATEMLSEGESEIIQFTADQVGEFEYYCSAGTHRAEGMYGNFIVEE